MHIKYCYKKKKNRKKKRKDHAVKVEDLTVVIYICDVHYEHWVAPYEKEQGIEYPQGYDDLCEFCAEGID
jgi:tRNA splicing ligase